MKPRGVLLESRRRTAKDLPDGTFVMIEKFGGVGFVISYARMDENGRANPGLGKPYGEVTIFPANMATGKLPCSNAYLVVGSLVQPKGKGWGGVLYEVALEIGSIMGTGLTSDRVTVSQFAHKVWAKYLNKRPDVKKSQLDNKRGELTPDIPSDDCAQASAVVATVRHGGKWHEQPESKVYTKKSPTMIRSLDKIGKFHQEPGANLRF